MFVRFKFVCNTYCSMFIFLDRPGRGGTAQTIGKAPTARGTIKAGDTAQQQQITDLGRPELVPFEFSPGLPVTIAETTQSNVVFLLLA